MSLDPVKLIPLTRRSLTRHSPTAEPGPITMFTTPAGSPAFSSNCIKYTADQGVSEAGLKTTVLPNAMAGAILRTGVTTGKFQGLMPATTPRGSITVWHVKPARSDGKVCPEG